MITPKEREVNLQQQELKCWPIIQRPLQSLSKLITDNLLLERKEFLELNQESLDSLSQEIQRLTFLTIDKCKSVVMALW